MNELKRVRMMTAHYRSLQGLRMLPWFLWMLAFSAVNPLMGLPQGRLDYQLLFIVPGLVVPWTLSRLIGTYYDRVFGRVEGLPSRNRLVDVLIGVAFVILAYIGFFVDSQERWPVSVFGLVLALAFLVQWWLSGRFLTHCVVTATLLAILSLLPLVGIPADGQELGGFMFPIILGIILSIGSVLGHIVLVRNLKSLPQGEP
ncbi:MAG TPA: hypothetical protein PKH77_13140 [Anaerolineae bacterium]|nr:hypothetical protein [Anaerolineae bacterium]